MSKILAGLMQEPADKIASLVFALEKLSGHPGIDVKLALEIDKVASEHMKRLGLDDQDTTSVELYHSLISRFEEDNQRFTRAIGGRSLSKNSDLAKKLLKILNQSEFPKSTWALKNSVAKDLLKSCPPKKTMKLLGYRSLDSLLKRGKLSEVFAISLQIESSTYHSTLARQYSKLSPGDFESRDIEFVILDESQLDLSKADGSNITYLPLFGVVAARLPRGHAVTPLSLAILKLEAAMKLRVSSSALELQRTSKNYGKVISNSRMELLANIGAEEISWRSIFYKYGQAGNSGIPAGLSSLVNPDDLRWQPVEESLRSVYPDLRWWLGLGYVGKIIDGKLVSFCISDVAANFANRRSVDDAHGGWLSQNVRDELISRYMSNEWVANEILAKLDSHLLEVS